MGTRDPDTKYTPRNWTILGWISFDHVKLSFSKLSMNRLAPPGESSSRRISWSCLAAHEVPTQLTSFTVASDPFPRIFSVSCIPEISNETNFPENSNFDNDIRAQVNEERAGPLYVHLSYTMFSVSHMTPYNST